MKEEVISLEFISLNDNQLINSYFLTAVFDHLRLLWVELRISSLKLRDAVVCY